MKKSLYLLVAFAAVLLSSCVKEQFYTGDEKVKDIIFSLDQFQDENGIPTKTGMSGTSFIWEATDTVGIFPESGNQVYFSMAAGANASSASFDGGGWELKNGMNYWSYYPLVGQFYLSKDEIPVDYAGQVQNGNNSNDHIGKCDFLYTDASTPSNGSLNFAFHHLSCILKPKITLPAGEYTKLTVTAPSPIFVEAGQYSLNDETHTIYSDASTTKLTNRLVLGLENVIFDSATEFVAYLMAYPVDVTDIPLTVSVFNSEGTVYQYSYQRSRPFAGGSIHNMAATSYSTAESPKAYLKFYDVGPDGATVFMSADAGTYQFTYDDPDEAGAEWSTINNEGAAASVSADTPLYFRGIQSKKVASNLRLEVLTAENNHVGIAVEGNINAIIDYTDMDATFAPDSCCKSLFSESNALLSARGLKLPALTVGEKAYSFMFEKCGNLRYGVESLPATTLAPYCYVGMYSCCYALEEAPVLSATTLAQNCYASMFNECYSLTEAPVLSATALAPYCYAFMFGGSKNLTTAPELPATELANGCYMGMFMSCTGLTTGPVLPAETTVSFGYFLMFSNCPSLTYLKALFVNNPTYSDIGLWLPDSTDNPGTLVARSDASWIGNTIVTIPSNWTIEYCEPTEDGPKPYIKFYDTASAGADVIITADAGTYQYTYDNPKSASAQWTTLSSSYGVSASVSSGRPLYVRGIQSKETASNLRLQVVNSDANASASIAVEGNINAIIDYTDMDATFAPDSCCNKLFYESNALLSARGLKLPALTLGEKAYAEMFGKCENLRYGVESLPATTLAPYCYSGMFSFCIALDEAPALPATTLAQNCYSSMFFECHALTEAPALSATTLAPYCYSFMFSGSKNLTTAPALPATELAMGCYMGMFSNCTGLTTGPVLPAETTVSLGYFMMFNNCPSLTYLKALFVNNPTYSDVGLWLPNSTTNSGTLVARTGASWIGNTIVSIPSNWTIEYCD